MTDPVAPPEPTPPYVARHTCTLLPSTDDGFVLDDDHRDTCTECGRPWRVSWQMSPGSRDTQPQWVCDGPPPPDWTPPNPPEDEPPTEEPPTDEEPPEDTP